MRQTELRLSGRDRHTVEEVRAKGLHHSREVNRAHILAALDRKVPQAQIMEVLGVERTAVWRTRAAYLAGGLQLALYDVARAGRPRQYDTGVEAWVAAQACSAPPAGVKRWTVLRLAQAAHAQPGMEAISRETIRRLLKKTASNHGAG